MTTRKRTRNLNPKRGLTAFLLALLLGSLSACSVYVTPDDGVGRVGYGIELGEVMTGFAPGRGEGATYYVGETITFLVRSREAGYLTLTAIDPDGLVYVFARNIPIWARHQPRFGTQRAHDLCAHAAARASPRPRLVFAAPDRPGAGRVSGGRRGAVDPEHRDGLRGLPRPRARHRPDELRTALTFSVGTQA